MAGHKSWNTNTAKILESPGARQRIDEYKHAIELATELAEVREQLGVTQVQVAEKLKTTQPNVSRIEHVEDIHLSTLVQYVKALGGKLLLEMVFPAQTFELDAEDIAPAGRIAPAPPSGLR